MENFKSLRNTLLIKDRVYNILKEEIILGNLKPGKRLNIIEIANKMNISSAPIREALNILSKDGLVDLMPHKSAVVAIGDLEDYRISADIRKLLEPYAAKISTKNIPKESINGVRQQLKNVLESPSDIVSYIESDLALHELLHIYAGSKFLSEMLIMVKTFTMRFRYLIEKTDGRFNRESPEITIATLEHIKILDAIESRDPEYVYSVVLDHIVHYSERNKPE